MVGWIILGSVLLLILIIVTRRLTVIFDYGEELFVNVSFAGFTVFQIPAIPKRSSKKRKPKKKRKKKKAEESDSGEKKSKKKKKKKLTLDDVLELARLALDSLGKPLRKILKRTEFSHLGVDVVCGGEDAAKAAINYGAANFALGSALSLTDQFFTLKTPDYIRVNVDFYSEKTSVKVCFEVKITVAAALAFAFSLIGRAVSRYSSRKGAKTAVKKLVG